MLYLTFLFPFFIICLIFIIKSIDNNFENNRLDNNKKYVIKKFKNLDEVLKNVDELNDAFKGIKPLIIKNSNELCINSIHKNVEKDNIYVETFNNNHSTIFNKYFGEHITLHMIGDYSKYYKTGDVYHKDVYIPESLRNSIPNIIENIQEQQKHIVCSCNGSKLVSIIDRKNSKKLLESNYTLTLNYPKPVIIERKYENKVLSKVHKYKFILKNECLIFNPFLQFHAFYGNKKSMTQVHFFVLQQFSKYANLIMPVEKKYDYFNKLYNRNIYKLKK